MFMCVSMCAYTVNVWVPNSARESVPFQQTWNIHCILTYRGITDFGPHMREPHFTLDLRAGSSCLAEAKTKKLNA